MSFGVFSILISPLIWVLSDLILTLFIILFHGSYCPWITSNFSTGEMTKTLNVTWNLFYLSLLKPIFLFFSSDFYIYFHQFDIFLFLFLLCSKSHWVSLKKQKCENLLFIKIKIKNGYRLVTPRSGFSFHHFSFCSSSGLVTLRSGSSFHWWCNGSLI